MQHNHDVYDSDTHFSINAITRQIRNDSSRKTVLIQNDHNSERFTFELPRHIEGHDMSVCDKVEVHYLNIGAGKDAGQNTGIYTVEDLQVSPDDPEKVQCSWLISNNATQLVGKLNFLLRFCCLENGVITYGWHTAIHSGISVSDGINADESFETDYVDIIEQWKAKVTQEITDDVNAGVSEWKETESGKVRGEMTAFSAQWNQALNVERERIDNIVALPDGSTTGDAELQDIRVGVNGKTYNSAGTAVREQIADIITTMDLATAGHVFTPGFDFGYRWLDESGVEHEDANYAITQIVDLTNCSAIKFRLYQYNSEENNIHLAMLSYFDVNLKHIEAITQIEEENGIVEAAVTPPDGAKYAIACFYKPIGGGYVQFYYPTVDGNTTKKVIDLCESPTSAGYIRKDGVVVADENWVYTDYIPVKSGEFLELSMHGHISVNSVSYYDSTKAYLSGVIADIEFILGATEKYRYGVEIVPDGVSFIRLCYRIGANTTSRCKITSNMIDRMSEIHDVNTSLKKLSEQMTVLSQNTEMALGGKIIFLAGDSRSSADYTFYGETMATKSGANVVIGGASGWTTAKIASNAYFERLVNSPHDFSLWLVGGNDTGASGTVGTFDSGSINGIAGESVVEETDISNDYNGTTFIQAVDHIIRKYKSLFYDWKTLDNGHKPKLIFCTDIPQKRSGGENTWSLPANWERKRQAILECCKKNNVACLDLYGLCNFDMNYEPEWTSPTDMVNNNGLYFMDGLHPNKYGIDIITSLEIEEIKKYLTIH